ADRLVVAALRAAHEGGDGRRDRGPAILTLVNCGRETADEYAPTMKNLSISKIVSVLSLFFSFTNFVPISAAISGFALLLYPFTFAAHRMPRTVVPLFIFFVYAAIG